MKLATKLKILKFVKKVLKYYESKELPPLIEIERFRIRKVATEHMYSDREVMMISEDQIHYALNTAIIEELVKNNLVKYSKFHSNFDAHVRIRAEVYIILPKEHDNRRKK